MTTEQKKILTEEFSKLNVFRNLWITLQHHIISEIIENSTKCCNACHKKLLRRIELIVEEEDDNNNIQMATEIVDSTLTISIAVHQDVQQPWSEEETAKIKECNKTFLLCTTCK